LSESVPSASQRRKSVPSLCVVRGAWKEGRREGGAEGDWASRVELDRHCWIGCFGFVVVCWFALFASAGSRAWCCWISGGGVLVS
jgi:hypothetical protein